MHNMHLMQHSDNNVFLVNSNSRNAQTHFQDCVHLAQLE